MTLSVSMIWSLNFGNNALKIIYAHPASSFPAAVVAFPCRTTRYACKKAPCLPENLTVQSACSYLRISSKKKAGQPVRGWLAFFVRPDMLFSGKSKWGISVSKRLRLCRPHGGFPNSPLCKPDQRSAAKGGARETLRFPNPAAARKGVWQSETAVPSFCYIEKLVCPLPHVSPIILHPACFCKPSGILFFVQKLYIMEISIKKRPEAQHAPGHQKS